MCLAFFNFFFFFASKFFPPPFIYILSILIPEPIPPRLNRFRAIVWAIVSASLVNKPGGGWVESVLILPDHFRCFLAAILSCSGIALTGLVLCSYGLRHDGVSPFQQVPHFLVGGLFKVAI